jgi:hypothetical protein
MEILGNLLSDVILKRFFSPAQLSKWTFVVWEGPAKFIHLKKWYRNIGMHNVIEHISFF